jgi:hypothetical protein
MAIGNIEQSIEIFYDNLVHFVFIWYIFSGLVIMYQGKSGNPVPLSCRTFLCAYLHTSYFFHWPILVLKPTKQVEAIWRNT